MRPSQITDWCHEIIRSQAAAGGFYIDATMGNGKDTLMLCTLAKETGSVLAFDIQDTALEATQSHNQRGGNPKRIKDSEKRRHDEPVHLQRRRHGV